MKTSRGLCIHCDAPVYKGVKVTEEDTRTKDWIHMECYKGMLKTIGILAIREAKRVQSM